MSIPVIENIAADILASINEITTGNGFNQTLAGKRPAAIDYLNADWDDLDVLITQVNSTEEDKPLNTMTRNQHFDIMAIIINAETSAVTIDTRLNQVFADIEKKMMEDPQRATLAIDTEVHDAVFFKDDAGGLTGVNIDVSVIYRTTLLDPYTQA